MLTFDNAAVRAGLAPPPDGGYVVPWATFDNNPGGTAADLGTSASAPSQAPASLPLETFSTAWGPHSNQDGHP